MCVVLSFLQTVKSKKKKKIIAVGSSISFIVVKPLRVKLKHNVSTDFRPLPVTDDLMPPLRHNEPITDNTRKLWGSVNDVCQS